MRKYLIKLSYDHPGQIEMDIEGQRKDSRYALRKRFNENTFLDVDLKNKTFKTPDMSIPKSFTEVCNPILERNNWSINENIAFLRKQVNLKKLMIFIVFKRLDLILHVSKLTPTNTNTRHNYAAIQNQ